MIWEEHLASRILNMAQNEVNERCDFCKLLSWKPVLDFFSSNEHEMNLNKRRRQPQSSKLGVLVFLCRNFLDFWFLSPPSWQLFLVKFARYCKFLQDRAKKSKKNVGVHSRQARITKIFAKEAIESCIKVKQDYSSFSCILLQICYLQPFLMDQIFYRKTRLFSQNCSTFSNFLRGLTNSIAFYSKFATSTIFEKIMFFSRTPFYFKNPITWRFEKSYHFCLLLDSFA